MTPASGQWWYKTLEKFTEQAHKFIFCLVSLLQMFVYCKLYLNLFNQIVQGIVFEFRKMVSKESKLKQLNSFKHLAYKQLGYYKGYFLLGIFDILWRHIWDVCCWTYLHWLSASLAAAICEANEKALQAIISNNLWEKMLTKIQLWC